MERLKQLIEKLNSEVDAGADKEQLMETVFDITRSIMEGKPVQAQRPDLSHLTPPKEPLSSPLPNIISEEVPQVQTDLADKLRQQPIDSIRSAMGINEKYIFLQTFFKGDSNAFDTMISMLDATTTYDGARVIMEDYIPTILMNDEQKEVLEKFDQLLKRRFFSI